MDLSVVIPVHNEEKSIGDLINEITIALSGRYQHEIIVVDDGSTDNTLEVLLKIKKKLPSLRVVKHLTNSGQSTAIRTGIQHAKSTWIATLDGDGQNDPADIPSLYNELINNRDSDPWLVVAGYRKKRKDTWLKRISSRYANGIRDKLLQDGTPDTGCGLKVFSRDSFLELPYFDHMHRYIPALFQRQGGRVVSVEVNHRHRMQGVSKYGFHNRLWVGVVDILGVRWLQRRARLTEAKEL
jgi:dolichol-phosphate mannosyltransferase